MKRLKKGFRTALLLFLVVVAFQQAARALFLLPEVSLRYDAPLTGEQVAAAREYGRLCGKTALTFWTERTVVVWQTFASVIAVQITFDGEADVAFPAEYTFGRAPSGLEPETCAVSTGFAWMLWGSEEIVGLELTAEGSVCRVVGVFEWDAPLLLRPDAEGFTAVELQGLSEQEDSYRQADTFAGASGLGTPDEILWGTGFGAWLRCLPWLSLTAVGLCAGTKRGPRKYRGWGLCLALLFAIALPNLLQALPPWLIPTRWSDFEFWSQLWQTLSKRCHDLVALTPQFRDTEAKLAGIKAILACLGACVLLPGWLRRSH